MFNLKHLRISIILLWAVILGIACINKYYDTTLPPVFEQANHLLAVMPRPHFFDVMIFITMLTLIYSSAALWFGHISGKYGFLIFTILALCASNYGFVVTSGLDRFANDLGDIINGAIVMLLFCSPLREYINLKKELSILSLTIAFFIFLLVYSIVLSLTNTHI